MGDAAFFFVPVGKPETSADAAQRERSGREK
jgi:hypothetical protein